MGIASTGAVTAPAAVNNNEDTQSKRPPQKHLGAYSEHIARAFLLREGYEVFANISACGYADLVAWKDNNLWLVDVKSGVHVNGASRLKPEQRQAGIVSLCVDDDGRCVFDPEQEQLRSQPELNTLLKASDLKELIAKNPHVWPSENPPDWDTLLAAVEFVTLIKKDPVLWRKAFGYSPEDKINKALEMELAALKLSWPSCGPKRKVV